MDTLRKSQSGFTLIELMIAMVVTLLILAGLFYSVIGDLRAYESARGTQGIVAKNRMIVQTMRLYIQQAGFKDFDALEDNEEFDAETTSNAGWAWSEGQIIQGAVNSTVIADAKADTDIIALRFSGATQSGIVSCDGTDLTGTDTVEVTLYVNNNNQLMCQDDGDAALLLDEDIEFLEVLYGTSEDASRYYTAANVTDWTTVNRVKVGILISQDVSFNNLINNNNYTIFNQTISAANDTNYRSVVMETILIGN